MWQLASLALHGDLASISLAGALAQLWPNYGDPLGWGVIAYTAIGPGALSAFLQVKVRPCLVKYQHNIASRNLLEF